MAISNAAIADTLRRYAAVLSLEGADRFKLKAYRRAAQTIEALDHSVGDFIAEGGKLTDLPGIGKAISEIVLEIVQTGTLSRLEKTIAKLTPERAELATRPALDAEKVGRIYKKLGISGLSQLKQALDSGAIGQQLGSRMEFHVRRGLDDCPRHLLYTVEGVARSLQQFLESLPDAGRVSTTGSLRRKQDTVGDLNLLVASGNADAVFQEFASSGAVRSTGASECQ